MTTTLARKDGPGLSLVSVAETARKNNYILAKSSDKVHAAQIADRVASCVTKLRNWMHKNRITIAELAKSVGVSLTAASSWTRAGSRPQPIWRLRIQELTSGEVPAVEWSSEREIRASRAYIEFYENVIQKKRDAGVDRKKRLAYRDGDKMRLYNACIIAGKEIPYEVRAFIERSPNGAWKNTGPA